MSRLMRSEDGFTLIELLIVIAILAILVSIVAINVTGIMTGVADTAMSTEKSLVQLAIDRYNTWDVAVNGKTPIAASGSTAAKIAPEPSNENSFARYLTTTTRYYYTWGDGGTNLTVSEAP